MRGKPFLSSFCTPSAGLHSHHVYHTSAEIILTNTCSQHRVTCKKDLLNAGLTQAAVKLTRLRQERIPSQNTLLEISHFKSSTYSTWQRGWIRSSPKGPSNPNYSVILWFPEEQCGAQTPKPDQNTKMYIISANNTSQKVPEKITSLMV